MSYSHHIGEFYNDDKSIWTIIVHFEYGTFAELELHRSGEFQTICGDYNYELTEEEIEGIISQYID